MCMWCVSVCDYRAFSSSIINSLVPRPRPLGTRLIINSPLTLPLWLPQNRAVVNFDKNCKYTMNNYFCGSHCLSGGTAA